MKELDEAIEALRQAIKARQEREAIIAAVEAVISIIPGWVWPYHSYTMFGSSAEFADGDYEDQAAWVEAVAAEYL